MPSASSQKQIPLRHCVISTQTHSKAQGSMYHDEPIFQSHHNQQPQHSTSVEVATTLWPQQTINYWFPNWRELFHGFTVVQGGQPSPSSFEQNGGVTCTQHHARSCPSPSSRTQYLHLGTDDPTQSPHYSGPLTRQISSPLTSSGTSLPHSHLDDATRLPHPGSTVSHAAAKSPTLPLLEKVDQMQKGDAHIACPPSSWAAPGPITKYTIKSPCWLPQDWVTEIQMRRTGTTADKYFKHLVSGRRFRSRNEVLHFISTGKGRTRKRDRRKKSLALTASHSLTNNFAHKKFSAFAASKLFHPTHVGIPLLTGPKAELRPNGEPGPPSKQSICFSASSSIWGPESSLLQSTQPAQEKPQKLPVKKKAKTLALKPGENKQTSKLWQWFKQPGVEKKASEMADQRNGNDLSLNDTASQRTVQLGRDIQAAHKTVVQISREMQATAEKFSREIREAQKDVEFCSDLKLSGVPAEMQVASINKTEAGRICRDTEATPRACMMTGSAVQVHVATNNLPQQVRWPDSAVGYASNVVQKPNDMMGILKPGDLRLDVSPQPTNFALNAITRERSFALDCMSRVTQPAIWPDVGSHQGTPPAQMADGSHTAKRQVDTSSHATQPTKTASATTVNVSQAAQLHVVAPIHIQQSTEATVGDVTQPALLPGVLTLNVAQPTQIVYIEKGSNTKAAERCGFVDGHPTEPAHITHIALTQAPQRHVVMSTETEPAHITHIALTQAPQRHVVMSTESTKAAQRQMAAVGHLLPTTERPVSSIGHANAPVHNPAVANALGNVVPSHANLLYTAQVSVSCEVGSTMQAVHEEAATRRYQDRKAKRLRRKKFAAVLNPKLDLSRLNPALTARQRAKAVQRMKTRHARALLATLGLHLCRTAIRRSIMY